MTAKTKSDLGKAIGKAEKTDGRNRGRVELDRTAEVESETEAHRKPFEMFGGFSHFGPL